MNMAFMLIRSQKKNADKHILFGSIKLKNAIFEMESKSNLVEFRSKDNKYIIMAFILFVRSFILFNFTISKRFVVAYMTHTIKYIEYRVFLSKNFSGEKF